MFSVIVATRDRPAMLERALRSVAAQGPVEVVLVDDSAIAASRERNAALAATIVPGAIVVALPGEAAGSGPGAARNAGMIRATGEWLAFLDDDDEWIDPDWLRRAEAILQRFRLDMLFADQVAVRADGSVVAGPVWTEDLAAKLPAAGVAALDDAFILSAEQVLLSDGFAHLNTTLIRRTYAVETLGGFDPTIRYEEDRDFQFRAIDRADGIGYLPLVVARHHVPADRPSASGLAAADRDECRLRVLQKAAGSQRPALRERAERDRAFALRRVSTRAVDEQNWAVAVEYGWAALRARFGWKWALFLLSLYPRRALSRRSQATASAGRPKRSHAG